MEEPRKFIWVGRNRKHNEIWASPPMTTTDILKGNHWSFFSLENRADGGNCEFLCEIFEYDLLMLTTTSSQSSMGVRLVDGVFIGIGPFNTHPLQTYFESPDFVSIKVIGREAYP